MQQTDVRSDDTPARHSTAEYLRLIGVPDLPARTSVFDPGYDPHTLESHLAQSSHLIASLKISMACWQIASEAATRAKVRSARSRDITVSTGGGPFEVAATFGVIPQYLDLCADIGVTRVEAGAGFTEMHENPTSVVRQAAERGLEVQYELGEKHSGAFTDKVVQELIDEGRAWLDAGAKLIVVEARESAKDVGLFGADERLDTRMTDRFAETLGLELTLFEAPTKQSQFALMKHLGPGVQLGNVRIEELLRVEIYRRGLHSDAFQHSNLSPKGPGAR